MAKISIIIPYHNVEDYLEKCLTSVKNQTFSDIEIICVNDCSEDNSLQIVQNFVDKDNRFININLNQKSGQSVARNEALKIAKGEYIGFVDADDWVDETMFEKLYTKAISDNTDITMCQAFLFDEETSLTSTNDYYSLYYLKDIQNKTFNYNDISGNILDINVVIWNKIFKKEFLNNINAQFENGYIFEDLPFFFYTFLKAEKVNIVWESLYYYRQNRKNSTMLISDEKLFDRIKMVEKTFNMLKETSFYNEKKIDIISWVFNDIFHRYLHLNPIYFEKFYYEMQALFKQIEFDENEKEALQEQYYAEEFFFIRENDFINFNNYIMQKFEQYKEDLANKKSNLVEWWQKYYEKEIKNLKSAYESQLIEQQQTHENYLAEYNAQVLQEKEEREAWHKDNLNNELSMQKTAYENQIEEIKTAHKTYLEEYNTKIAQEKEEAEAWHKDNLEKELSMQKQAYEGQILEQKNAYEDQITNIKTAHETYLEEYNTKISQEKEEMENWHNNNLQTQLKSQAEWFEQEIERRKKEVENWHIENLQKTVAELNQKHEDDIKPIKLIVKAIRKIRKIKNKKQSKTPKVSIILPIYNVDKYLKQSLDSLLNQTLKEIEIICVNDGSTDKCYEILEEYKKKDNRIKVIHTKNQGTGAARNEGLKIATGECIGFVDPDDWAKSNMFDRLYKLIKEKDCDIVMSMPDGYNEQKQTYEHFPYFCKENFECIPTNKIFSWKDLSPFKYPMCVWNKLYKKELFDKYNIDFAQGLDFEDHKVIFGSLLNAEKIYYVPEKLYVYRHNREGSVLSDKNRRLLDQIEIFDIVENIMKETKTFDHLKQDFLTYKIHNMLYYYGDIKEEFKAEFKEKMIISLKKTQLTSDEEQILCEKYPELKELLSLV